MEIQLPKDATAADKKWAAKIQQEGYPFDSGDHYR